MEDEGWYSVFSETWRHPLLKCVSLWHKIHTCCIWQKHVVTKLAVTFIMCQCLLCLFCMKFVFNSESKSKSSSYDIVWRQTGGLQVELYSCFNLGTRWRWVINALPWLVWASAEIFSQNKIQSSNYLASGKLLSRLCCPSPLVINSFPLQLE
jgi:hypothetical protein